MKNTIFPLIIVLALAGISFAQTDADKALSASTRTASAASITVSPGTEIAGKLQSSLDVRKSRVGDQVLLKTTKTVKQKGRTVIEKGSTLIGRVTAVRSSSRADASSSISILFNEIQKDRSRFPLNAAVTSVIQATSAASLATDDSTSVMGSSSAKSTASTSSGTGLLGGVTNSVSGVLDTTTQTVGSVARSADGVAGSATSGLGASLRGLSITQSTSASAKGSSTLSLSSGNLRLEKGTTLNLVTTSETSIGNN